MREVPRPVRGVLPPALGRGEEEEESASPPLKIFRRPLALVLSEHVVNDVANIIYFSKRYQTYSIAMQHNSKCFVQAKH